MYSAEQRSTTRFPVTPEREPAVLRVGRQSIEGRLLNESSGGFGVRVEAKTPIAAGQVLLLGSASGWSRVRVTHSKPDDDGAYVGLERLADLPQDWEGGSELRWWPFDRLRFTRPGGDRSAYIVGIMVVFGLIFSGTLWYAVSDGGGPHVVLHAPGRVTAPRSAPPSRAEVARASVQPTSSVPQAVSPTSPEPSRSSGIARVTQTAFDRWLARWSSGATHWAGGLRTAAVASLPSPETAMRQSGQKVEQWADQVQSSWDQVRDEVLLLLPNVEDDLQLTDQQRTQIQAIVRDSRENVQKVYRDAPDKNSPAVWQEIQRVRKEAGEQALAQLTEQQQQRLLALRAH